MPKSKKRWNKKSKHGRANETEERAQPEHKGMAERGEAIQRAWRTLKTLMTTLPEVDGNGDRRSQAQMERGKAEANRQRQTRMDEEIPPNLWTVFALRGMRAAPMKGG